MKHTIKTLIALMISTTAFAQASGGNDGHGGGGITKNGRYMTFYSAGFYVDALEATADEIPQLSQLIKFVETTSFISAQTKVKWLTVINPSVQRHYYKVKASSFTPAVRAKLIAEYGRVMNINASEVALFGVTDTNNQTTYLFPEFYSLKPTEQMAILFHENYWIVNPNVDYKKVINTEMAFQAFIEDQSSFDKLQRFLGMIGTDKDLLVAAINADLKSGALTGLVNGSKIKFVDLFGDQFIECAKINNVVNTKSSKCIAYTQEYLSTLSLKYKNSLFLKVFKDYFNRYELEYNLTGYCDSYYPNLTIGDNPWYKHVDVSSYWSSISPQDIDLENIIVGDGIKFNVSASYQYKASRKELNNIVLKFEGYTQLKN